MAAAQRGRKTAPPRRRQTRYGRKSPAKARKSPARRGRQTRPTPAGKRGKSQARKRNRSPTPYDAKMLRQLQRGPRQMSSQAKGLMVSFMNDMYRKVSAEAHRLRKESRHSTVGPSQMKAALQEVMPAKQARQLVASFSKKSR